ncbi:MAG TPA: hypothetical protein VKD72_31770 [Gemmataceae bacterium]|nr:hypothetical protein [Gemmataceae bacterium]
MVVPQAGEHLLIAVRAEDTVEDDVVAMVQRIPGQLINHADVRTAWTVLFLENRPPYEILRDPRDAAVARGTQRGRHGAFPGT